MTRRRTNQRSYRCRLVIASVGNDQFRGRYRSKRYVVMTAPDSVAGRLSRVSGRAFDRWIRCRCIAISSWNTLFADTIGEKAFLAEVDTGARLRLAVLARNGKSFPFACWP